MKELRLIVAYDRNRLIGANGDLPWHLPEDLSHFQRTTMHHAIIMGRKTFQSIRRALPGRTNIIVSRSGYEGYGARTFRDLESAIKFARATGDDSPFIIGGGRIYRAAMPLVTEVIATEINAEYEGDTYFPELGPEFVEIDRRSGEDPRLQFVRYRRGSVDKEGQRS